MQVQGPPQYKNIEDNFIIKVLVTSGQVCRFAIQYFKHFSVHLNNVATLHCETQRSQSIGIVNPKQSVGLEDSSTALNPLQVMLETIFPTSHLTGTSKPNIIVTKSQHYLTQNKINETKNWFGSPSCNPASKQIGPILLLLQLTGVVVHTTADNTTFKSKWQ